MSLHSRLMRLENGRGPCPDCGRRTAVIVQLDAAGNVVEGRYPEPCPRCGRTPRVVEIVEEVVTAGGRR
jgi:endogenous inhibitor of DNA gyrase (YacG/DUF329 family)